MDELVWAVPVGLEGTATKWTTFGLVGTPFRDANLADLVARKRAELVALEAEVSPILAALVPEEIARLVREQRPIAFGDQDLIETNAALDLVTAAWEELRARAPEVRACGGPDVTPPMDEPGDKPWFFEEQYDRKFREALDVALLAHGGESARRWGHRGYQGRFSTSGTSFVLTCTSDAYPASRDNVYERSYTSHLTMHVGASAVRLGVTTRGVLARLKEALHLSQAQLTNDAAFDPRFVVQGTFGAAALLTADVRERIMRLVDRYGHERSDTQPLTLARSLVTVAWSHPTSLTDFLEEKQNDILSPLAIDLLLTLRATIQSG